MVDSSDPIAWIERAEEDYVVARSVLRRKVPLVYPACFHAQQCVEKYMKAILIANGAAFPKTHDLLMLASLCDEAGVLLPVEKKELNALNDFSIRVRYPGASPTIDEAKEAIEIVKRVCRYMRRYFDMR